jgi:hypothetical protein
MGPHHAMQVSCGKYKSILNDFYEALQIVPVLPNTFLHKSRNRRKALVRAEIQKKFSLKLKNIGILSITKLTA